MKRSPESWALATGGDVFEVVTSGSRGWAQHYAAAGSSFIRVGNLDHDSISLDLRDVQHVNPPPGAEGERTRLMPNDVLISITADVGMVAVVPPNLGPAYINQHIALARPKVGVEPRFVAWYLASEADGKRSLRDVSRGGTKSGLGLDDIREVEIALAPLGEQQRIANKLDTVLARVDACRDRLARVAPLLKRFRQSVLAAATAGHLTQEFRGDVLANDELPAGWSLTTMRAVAADIRYGTSKKCAYQDTGIPVLRIPNIGDGGKVQLGDIKRAEFTDDEVEALRLRVGDLLVIRSNGSIDLVGRAAVVAQEQANMLFAGYLIRLRISPSIALPDFIYLCLSEPAQRAMVESVSKSTSGVNNINAQELLNLRLRLPPLGEQAEIVRRVELLFAFATRLEARLANAQTAVNRLTPALLSKAFRGELVPQDPNDEPAAELLRRLAQNRPPAATDKKSRARPPQPSLKGA